MIKDILKIGVALAAGTGIGYGLGYLILNKKYEDRSNKEIDEVRQIYIDKIKKRESGELNNMQKAAISKYAETLVKRKEETKSSLEEYINNKEKEETVSELASDIRIISEEVFDASESDKYYCEVYSNDIVRIRDKCEFRVISLDEIKTLLNEEIYYEIQNTDDDVYVVNVSKDAVYEFSKQFVDYNE